MHEEHVGWLSAFRQIVVDREPTYIAESFLMLGQRLLDYFVRAKPDAAWVDLSVIIPKEASSGKE